MKTILTFVAIIACGSICFGDETDPRVLDPSKPNDYATLVEMVERPVDGRRNLAATRLAETGHIEALLGILRSTQNYNTMQAIAQTRNERVIPTFEWRLRREPENRQLVGSFALVRNRKASPILLELLRRNPDAAQPVEHDMVGGLLNAIVLNRCHDAIPALHDRFAACGAVAQADRKSNYAISLLALGDPVGIPWLIQRIDDDLSSKAAISWTADRLATICDWQLPSIELVDIQDEAIMTPLLPVLIRGAASADCGFSGDCVRVLRVLTRHNFPEHDAAWQNWYQKHAARHAVYSRPLDRAAELAIATFRKKLTEESKRNQSIKVVDSVLGQPENGWGSHSDFLWKLHSQPEDLAVMPLRGNVPPREKLREYGLTFIVSQTSRLKEPEHILMRQDFDGINLTVCLASPTGDKLLSEPLIAMAKEACKILAQYESFHTKVRDVE